MQIHIEGLEAHVRSVVEEVVGEALASRADDPWLSAKEAAAYIGLAVSTLHDYISDGRLPRHGGRKTKIMLRRSDLDAYLTARGCHDGG